MRQTTRAVTSKAVLYTVVLLLFICSNLACAMGGREEWRAAYGKMPLGFISNEGQADSRARFIVSGPEGTAFFTDRGVALKLCEPDRDQVRKDLFPLSSESSIDRYSKEMGEPFSDDENLQVGLWVSFIDARAGLVAEGAEQLPGKTNYLVGSDPSGWKTGISTYKSVIYTDVWPGIDVVYRGDRQRLKYDINISPGADPEKIRLLYRGADKLSVSRNGDLVINTAVGRLTEGKPVIYQEKDGEKVLIDGRFTLQGSVVGFRLGEYDPSLPLVIDPAADLWWSTFLGGSSYEHASAAAVDFNSCVYVTGVTKSSDFPTTTGVYNTTFKGDMDVFVAMLDPSGSYLVYSTIIGGTMAPVMSSEPGGYDSVEAIALDRNGCVYITGFTGSSDFPLVPAGQSIPPVAGGNAFLTKLDPIGSSIVYSTEVGGAAGDYAYGLAVDSAGCAYIAGTTTSADFPFTSGAFDTGCSGQGEAFVMKMAADGMSRLYSTFLGGSSTLGADKITSIAVDKSGCAYVTGETWSYDFPFTQGAYDTSLNGTLSDCFVAKLNPNATALVYATAIGGTGADTANDIAIDSSGNAYIAGKTESSDFPTTPGAFDTTINGYGSDGFVAKINPTGTALAYSTFLGGRSFYYDDVCTGITVDSVGCALVTGHTASPDFPVVDGALDSTYSGGFSDAFIAKLNATGSELVYSTFFGGCEEDSASRVVMDPYGFAYVVGETWSVDFPTTPGAIDTRLASGDAFIAKFMIQPVLYIKGVQGGTTTPAAGGYSCATNQVISVKATPSQGYAFECWQGPVVDQRLAATSVIMDCSKSIAPVFAPFVKSARIAATGAAFNGSGMVVSAVFPECFYVESETRECGIKIDWQAVDLSVGQRVNVIGTVMVAANGEKCVRAASVALNGLGTGSIKPIAMPVRSIGGGDWQWNPQTRTGQRGMSGASGLNNIGLLVRTCGRVTVSQTGRFVIDDGSGSPLEVLLPADVSSPAEGAYAFVTGISTCLNDNNGGLYPVLRVRTQQDITLPYRGTGLAGSVTTGGVQQLDKAVECAHPYKWMAPEMGRYSIQVDGASKIRVHFEKVQLDGIGDTLTVGSAYGTGQVFHDALPISDVWSNWVQGDTAYIALITDRDVEGYGFKIDKVEIPVSPVAGCRITLDPGQAITTTSGTGGFAFHNLAPGTYTLTPANSFVAPSSATVTIGQYDFREDMDFRRPYTVYPTYNY